MASVFCERLGQSHLDEACKATGVEGESCFAPCKWHSADEVCYAGGREIIHVTSSRIPLSHSSSCSSYTSCRSSRSSNHDDDYANGDCDDDDDDDDDDYYYYYYYYYD